MTFDSQTTLAHLAERAFRAATCQRTVDFGPIQVRLLGASPEHLERIAQPLVASAGVSWAPLQVVVATADSVDSRYIPPALRPRRDQMIVAHREGITALANGSDGTLWLLDPKRATATLWIKAFDALPVWEHTSPLRTAARWWSTVQGAAMVHAGAVADDERAVLLVGDSGVGKSTTALSCHRAGLEVLGDDFCFVEPPTSSAPATAHAMYRLAKLDENALNLLPHLRSQVIGTGWRGKKLLDLGHDSVASRPIAAMCHVVQEPNSPTAATPLARAQLLRAVAPSTMFQQRLWEHETWNVLASTVRSVHCYRLSVSNPIEAPAVLRSILEADPL